jgi:DNA-directed RNA polymerase subunit RPC12/RpoP
MKKIMMVCLANKFGDKCAKATADKLGLLYLNVDDYIEYALGDMGEMLFKCGREYLEGQINLHTNKAIDFENTLFYCGYKTFMKNKEKFKGFNKVYLALTLKQLKTLAEKNYLITKITFPDRHKILMKYASKVECSELNPERFAEKAILEAKNEN